MCNNYKSPESNKIISINSPEDLEKAAYLLSHSGIVALPTETVYGLGANAFDAHAVARIFAIKERPYFDPLIVHIADLAMLSELTTHIPEKAQQLIENFWPGPLTLVLPKSDKVPDLVTSGLSTVAVRMPAHEIAQKLIRKAGVPVAAPSANPFGQISPVTALHVYEQLGQKVDLIVDGGACRVGVESTIIAFKGEQPILLRPGGYPLEQLEAVIGPITRSFDTKGQPLAPGTLPQHYAPHTCMRLYDDCTDTKGSLPPNSGLITLQRRERNLTMFSKIIELSLSGDLCEAAAQLYSSMRVMDKMGLDCIYAELVPEYGLGLAINDRLRRAAKKFEGENDEVGV